MMFSGAPTSSAVTGNRTNASRRICDVVTEWDLDRTAAGGCQTVRLAPFDFMFPGTNEDEHVAHPERPSTALVLAAATMWPEPAARDVAGIARFVVDDVVAAAGRSAIRTAMERMVQAPLPRSQVVRGLGNMRSGAIRLESIYRSGPIEAGLHSDVRRSGDPSGDPALLQAGALTNEDAPADLLAPPGPLPAAEAGPRTGGSALREGGFRGTLIHFHNRLVLEADRQAVDPDDRYGIFRRARRLVRWHVQWLVLNELLPTLCDPDIVSDVVARKAPLYEAFLREVGVPQPGLLPVPLEAAVAALRCGPDRGAEAAHWLDLGSLFNIPDAQACLDGIGLATGDDMPRLSRGQIAGGVGSVNTDDDVAEHTPLWGYLMLEAHLLGSHGRLGPLGSRLMAETFCGLVIYDPASFWNAEVLSGAGPRWGPEDGAMLGGSLIDCFGALRSTVGLDVSIRE